MFKGEVRYALAFAATTDGVWERDFRAGEVNRSPRLLEMLGLEPGELHSSIEAFEALIHPEDAEHCRLAMRAHLETRAPYHHEYRVRHKSGDYIWISAKAQAVWDSDGKLERMAGSFVDISDRKSADKALRESEDRLRAFIDHSPSRIFLKDTESRILAANKAYLEENGLTEDQALGKIGYEWLGRETVEKFRRQDLKIISSGQPFETEVSFIDSTGKPRFRHSVKFPMRDATGHIVGIGCIGTDITERKRTESELRETENRFRAFIDNTPSAIMIKDMEGRYLLANKCWNEWFNPKGVDIAGKSVFDFYGREHAEEVMAQDRAVAEAGVTIERELETPFADGVTRNTLMQKIPIPDQDGNIVAIGGVNTDITKLKRAEADLRKSKVQAEESAAEIAATNERLRVEIVQRKRAELTEVQRAEELSRSNAELERFASVAAHDLQEPLRKVQAFGDRLKQKYSDILPEDGQGYIDRMQSAAERMQLLIDALMEYSRVGTRGGAFGRVDMNEVARGVASDLEETISRAGAKLEIGDLPWIDADPMQMRQLLQNLIGNGLKFQREGIQPVVTISASSLDEPDGDRTDETFNIEKTVIVVKDNGIGFDPDQAAAIFEVFKRLHGRSEYAGSGIGLSICRRIAERHHGGISAHGSPGEGAEFRIILPVRQAKQEDAVEAA